MQVTPRRWQLRDTTAKLHEAVDSAVGTFASREGYSRYLTAIYRFRAPIERRMTEQAWPEAFGAWRPNMISAEMTADMADLGLQQPDLDDTSVPDSPDALLGTLYVLEGSALGARLLLKRAEALGLNASFGARHLARQSGEASGWRAFLTLLEDAEPLDMEQVSRASIIAFGHAETAFKGL